MAGAHGRRMPSSVPRLAPLVLGTLAGNSLLVVLGPTMVAVAGEFAAPDGAVGQARTIAGAAAILASPLVAQLIDRAHRIVAAPSYR